MTEFIIVFLLIGIGIGLWIYRKKTWRRRNGWDYEHEKSVKEKVKKNLPDKPTKGQRVAVPGTFKPSSWIFYVEEPMPDWICDTCEAQGSFMDGSECPYCAGKGRIKSPPFSGWMWLDDESITRHEEWLRLKTESTV